MIFRSACRIIIIIYVHYYLTKDYTMDSYRIIENIHQNTLALWTFCETPFGVSFPEAFLGSPILYSSNAMSLGIIYGHLTLDFGTFRKPLRGLFIPEIHNSVNDPYFFLFYPCLSQHVFISNLQRRGNSYMHDII
jgi:hypothetical protein